VESEIKAEIMIISKRIDDYDVAVNIEKETPKYDKYAKHHHKFHNQKPSKAKGIYGNSRRK
jgi:ribosomal protein S17